MEWPVITPGLSRDHRNAGPRGVAPFAPWSPASGPQTPSIHSPGAYPQRGLLNANVSVSYGAQIPSYGVQNTSYGEQIAYHGGEKASYMTQNDSFGGHLINYAGHNANYGGRMIPHLVPGTIPPSNAPTVQNPSYILSPAVDPTLSQPNDAVQSTNFNEIDVPQLLSNVSGLITQANQAVREILSMVKMKPFDLPRKCLDPQIGNDNIHDVDTVSVSGELRQAKVKIEDADNSNDFSKASVRFGDTLKALKEQADTSNDIFYKDAPAVVQVPVFADTEKFENFMLPSFAVGESWAELLPKNTCEGGTCLDSWQPANSLLPSRFWLLRKEISTWTDFPLKYTSIQLKAAVGIARVNRADLKRWLLTHAHSYGVNLSRYLADHIVLLLVFCLRAVHREALTHAESPKTGVSGSELVEFRVFSESAFWLSSVISLLFDAGASKNLVFGLYKYALEASAFYLAFSQRAGNGDLEGREATTAKCTTSCDVSPEQKSNEVTCAPLEIRGDRNNGSLSVGDGALYLHHVAVAILAIRTHAALALGNCANSHSLALHSPAYQRSALHSMLVQKAEEVRATRANYRSVLEHDGLIWQRLQNEESKKNKTKEELLAEERDYKRRRMSYRGKKVQRTPAEVLRDIIDSHMEEIVAAGGIGRFGRKPQAVSEEPSTSGAKAQTDTDQRMRLSSREVQDNESYFDHSRQLRSESRGPDTKDRESRYVSTSSNSRSRRSDSPLQDRHDYGRRSHQDRSDFGRRSHDNRGDRYSNERYESTRKHSRWESRPDDGKKFMSSHSRERLRYDP